MRVDVVKGAPFTRHANGASLDSTAGKEGKREQRESEQTTASIRAGQLSEAAPPAGAAWQELGLFDLIKHKVNNSRQLETVSN